jgi:uncharacterized protein with NRDE domain
MCLLGLAFHLNAKAPLLVLANREECWKRPSQPPQLNTLHGNNLDQSSHADMAEPKIAMQLPSPSFWFGGVDLKGGGTWLGVNAHGVVAAITNRLKSVIPQQPISRGLLCRAALAFNNATAAAAFARAQLAERLYAGCNLLLADCNSAFVIESGDVERFSELGPGLHLTTNQGFEHPRDQRALRVRARLPDAARVSVGQWVAAAAAICGLHAENGEPAICLHTPASGTVSASVVVLANNRNACQFWHAAGPPCGTPFEDLSEPFRNLIGLSAQLANVAAGSDGIVQSQDRVRRSAQQ